VKFIDNPDPYNKNQALLNLEMGDILTTDNIRNTYIRLLIDRFINISSKIRKEVIPNKIREDCTEYIADSNVVLGFIMDNYIITNNDKDRISSSELFAEFKDRERGTKMTASKFKEDVLNIGGITSKKISIVYFCGLRVRVNEDNEINE
jgi:hypothetical protein